MRPEVAAAVYPVFAYGIRLKESLAAGESPELANAQMELLGLLQACGNVQRWADVNPRQVVESNLTGARASTEFLGIRYALTVWLDEIFIADSPWRAEWSDRILELQAYRTRDRAWRFWDQWKKAETQPSTDSLEVYYLCALLGFRGDLEENPKEFRDRLETAKTLIEKSAEPEWPSPVDSTPRTDVPPLLGFARFQRMATVVGLSMLLLAPVAMFYIFHFLVKR